MTRTLADVQKELDDANGELEAAQGALERAEEEVMKWENTIADLQKEIAGLVETELPDGFSVDDYAVLLGRPAAAFGQLDTLRLVARFDGRFAKKLRDVELHRVAERAA
jgi:hypothetical protein